MPGLRGALPEALGMQRGQDAGHGDRGDAEDAGTACARNQQDHDGQLRPWRAPCA